MGTLRHMIVALRSCIDDIAVMQKGPFGTLKLNKILKSGRFSTFAAVHSPMRVKNLSDQMSQRSQVSRMTL